MKQWDEEDEIVRDIIKRRGEDLEHIVNVMCVVFFLGLIVGMTAVRLAFMHEVK